MKVLNLFFFLLSLNLLTNANIIVPTCPSDNSFVLKSRESCMLLFTNKKLTLSFDQHVQALAYDCDQSNKCKTYQIIENKEYSVKNAKVYISNYDGAKDNPISISAK